MRCRSLLGSPEHRRALAAADARVAQVWNAVGRLATAFIMPTILWVQNGYGLMTVFVCLAILLCIAAYSVTQLGPEARQKGLDEIAPPTG